MTARVQRLMSARGYFRSMEPGDEIVIRATGEHVRVVAILDGAGTLLVRADGDEFQTARDEVEFPWEKHASCACCG